MTEGLSWLYGTSGRATDDEAARLFEEFVAAAPESLLKLETLTDIPSDLNLATLDRQVEIAVGRWSDHDPAAPVPLWFGELEARLHLGSTGAAVWDGLIHRVAMILSEHLGTTWVLFKDERPHAAGHNQPALSNRGATPWSLVRKAIIGLRTERTTSAWLREHLESTLDQTQSPRTPAAGEERFEVFVQECDGLDWSHTGSLPEETAELLGDTAVERLWQEMGRTAGVLAMEMEDFPVSFLIRAVGVDASFLQHEFQRLFDQHLSA